MNAIQKIFVGMLNSIFYVLMLPFMAILAFGLYGFGSSILEDFKVAIFFLLIACVGFVGSGIFYVMAKSH